VERVSRVAQGILRMPIWVQGSFNSIMGIDRAIIKNNVKEQIDRWIKED
jgi:hypothetical protein